MPDVVPITAADLTPFDSLILRASMAHIREHGTVPTSEDLGRIVGLQPWVIDGCVKVFSPQRPDEDPVLGDLVALKDRVVVLLGVYHRARTPLVPARTLTYEGCVRDWLVSCARGRDWGELLRGALDQLVAEGAIVERHGAYALAKEGAPDGR